MKSRILFLIVAFGLFPPPSGLDAQPGSDDAALNQLKTFNQAFTAIARRVTPNVVTISTKQIVDETASGRRAPDFFHPFFQVPQPDQERSGLGSGIVMSRNGYILTNNHVIDEADEITVILSDNREYTAELIGKDEMTDVAIVKIEGDDLAPVRIGDSDGVQIGEWVLAIGAPLELRSTVTSGIVSAIGRSLDILSNQLAVEDFIQTDAAINPGNSGGALVNLDGELIGVNTAIATRNRGFVGYGFAIPINLARKVMEDIIEHGEVQRGYLGVSLQPVTAREAEAIGLDRPRGVLISQVMANTPAERAEIKGGDVILEVDGRTVDRPNALQSAIARKRPGDPVRLKVRRGSRDITLNAELGTIPEDARMTSVGSQPPGSATDDGLGLAVHNISAEIAESFGLDPGAEGVVVVKVSRGPARDAGLRQGDVILRVRQGSVDLSINSIIDFREALDSLEKGRAAAFSIMRRDRQGNDRYLFLTPRIPE